MKTTAIALIVLLEVGCIHAYDQSSANTPDKSKKEQKDKKNNGKNKEKNGKGGGAASADIAVLQSWEMPAELKEISGHALIDAERFACIQDEAGKIFIYNRSKGAVEQEIPFGDAADYEDIALVGSTAYVMRADGMLYEVANYRGGAPTVRSYSTGLTAQQDIEGLAYDSKGNRLLLSTKEKEQGNADFKSIYAFNLSTKSLATSPVYKINLADPLLQGGGKKGDGIMPSAVGRHPGTGELYIVDGPGARLFTMNENGTLKAVYNLGSRFPQPEGIAFSADGEVFISSEGGKGAGIIAQVKLN